MLSLCVFEEKLFLVLIKRNSILALDRTWTIAISEGAPLEGRDKLGIEGFSLPNYQLIKADDQIVVSTEQLKVTISQPLLLKW